MIVLQYPWIEWGVLFRSDLEGTARYASWSYVERDSHAAAPSQCDHTLCLRSYLSGTKFVEGKM